MTDPQRNDQAEDPRLAALVAWRQRLIDSGEVSPSRLKEAHLRGVLLSKRTDVEQIRAILPGSLAEHAEDIAAVLASLPSDTDTDTGSHFDGAAHADIGAQFRPDANPEPGAPPIQTGPPPEPPRTNYPPVDAPTRTTMIPVTPPPPPKTDQRSLAPTDFATFNFAEQRGEVHDVAQRRQVGPDGRPGPRELSWPPYLPGAGASETVVIYRLVSEDDGRPFSPDRSQLVAATTSTTATDDRPVQAAVRHYQVWVNFGGTRAEALAAQPVKHAEAVFVGSVRDFMVREEGGRVIGAWRVPPAVSRVHVYRVPAEHRGFEGAQHRICADQDNLTGFVDTEAVRGQGYRYVVRAAVAVDGNLRLSDDPAFETILISAVLSPIGDLVRLQTGQGTDLIDLTWTPPPGGEVMIFRTQNGPPAGTTELPAAALEQVGLGPDLRLNQPITTRLDDQGRTRSVMAGVSWPPQWSRGYLTPVTVLGGRALLGKSLPIVRTGIIRDVDLAEYCNKQVLTFDWPAGAAAVFVYKAPKNHDPANGLTGRPFEITFDEYERAGGLQLHDGDLPDRGCSLHLQPVAYVAGRRTEGQIRTINYPGLVRLWYSIQVRRDPTTGEPTHATIAMWAAEDLPGSPPFVLVNNPDRIPLSYDDGDPVDVAPLNPQGGLAGGESKELHWSSLTTHATGETWAAKLRGKQGWLRLFVNTSSAEKLLGIALLDPPVEQLRLPVAAAPR